MAKVAYIPAFAMIGAFAFCGAIAGSAGEPAGTIAASVQVGPDRPDGLFWPDK